MKVNPGIYKLAGEYAPYVRAFAIHESREDQYVVGDGGRAFGLLQMHPATFVRYYYAAKDRWAPHVDDTWTVAFIKACCAFLEAHNFLNLREVERGLVVQAWNRGEAAIYLEGKRAPEYLDAWDRALNQVRGEQAKPQTGPSSDPEREV